MKLKNISCTQFAGVRDRNISFSDGINVVYGKNESGKSTMANLIARTLFQKAKLDRRSNKEFCDLYFPSSRKGSNLGGDFADGKITFEAKSGAYTLSKEWGIDARCTLATPEGIVRDQAKIDEILKSVLNYGEGVYSDLLLTSQRNTDTALQTLLDASKKTEAKTEITDAVSLAFAESDGISVDAIEQAIQSRIDEISGKHWDIDREAPVRKAGRWSTGLGEILKAYYALENAKAVLDEISRLERDADQAAHDYADRDAEAHSAEEDYNEFNKFASSLILQKERKKAISRTEEELAKIRKVLVDWPQLEQVLAQAQTLQTESENRDILDKYDASKAIMSEINTLSLATANVSCPTADEIAQVKTSQSSVASLENKLCGMNLTAAIHMLGNNTIEVTSVRTGQKIDVSDEIANISEAVRIAIPGVMEMQLSPANVDAASVETQIKNNRQIVADIFENYQVESLEALEKLAQMIVENSRQLNAANSRLQQLLGTSTFEQLECVAKKLPQENRSKAEIETSIVTLCGKTELDMHNFFITKINDAMKEGRFIEASWLIYSCLENRYFRTVEKIKSQCKYSNGKCKKASNDLALKTKIKCVEWLSGDPHCTCFYDNFPTELLEKTKRWVKNRNTLMHNLLQLDYYEDMDTEFKTIATTGKELLEQTYTCCTKFRKDFYAESYIFEFPTAAMEGCPCKPRDKIN